MGYRSDVRIFTNEEGYKLIEEMCSNTICDTPLISKTVVPEEWEELNRKDGVYYVFGWNSIKWYGMFSEVRAFMRVIDELIDNETAPIHFIRIGEDYTDIEELFNDWGLEESPMYVEQLVAVV